MHNHKMSYYRPKHVEIKYTYEVEIDFVVFCSTIARRTHLARHTDTARCLSSLLKCFSSIHVQMSITMLWLLLSDARIDCFPPFSSENSVVESKSLALLEPHISVCLLISRLRKIPRVGVFLKRAPMCCTHSSESVVSIKFWTAITICGFSF